MLQAMGGMASGSGTRNHEVDTEMQRGVGRTDGTRCHLNSLENHSVPALPEISAALAGSLA
jgi:hypothetical protein